MATKKQEAKTETITISPPKFRTVEVTLEGTAPMMQSRFPHEIMQALMAKMQLGSQTKKGNKRPPRDFDAQFIAAQHISEEGWNGVPAAALRNACIDACRMVGFKMTHAKMSIFVEQDGFDKYQGHPLIKLDAPPPERSEMATRNATGVVDVRVRPMWRKWRLPVRVRFDEDQFSAQDVINLIARAGVQVGIGEGRPFSKSSNGLGFGTFRVLS
jgi:hypothetical protein